MKKVLIIGSGPAGISAALYLARSSKTDVTVSYSHESALEKAEKIENYFGFDEPVSGKELLRRGISGAKRLGVNFIHEEIVGLSIDENMRFEASTPTGNRNYDYVLIATGAARRSPDIEGMKTFEGHGISYCAVCDGFFFRNKPVAVIGSGEYAVHEALVLKNTASHVFMLTNGEDVNVSVPEGVTVNTKKISRIRGEKTVSGVEFTDGTSKEVNGVFIAIGTAGSVDLARKVGAAVDGSRIITDSEMQTTVPGLYAAGDCTGGIMQISTAVGEGATAALSIIKKSSK